MQCKLLPAPENPSRWYPLLTAFQAVSYYSSCAHAHSDHRGVPPCDTSADSDFLPGLRTPS